MTLQEQKKGQITVQAKQKTILESDIVEFDKKADAFFLEHKDTILNTTYMSIKDKICLVICYYEKPKPSKIIKL